MIDAIWQDIHYGVRSLYRTPGFSAAAIITLALGIGANTTIFTLLDAVLFKPLPVTRPNELVTVYEQSPDAPPDALPDPNDGTGRYLRFSYPRFLRLQQALGSNGSMAATTLSTRFVGRTQGSPRPSPVMTQLVSGLYFSTLGVTMQRGRALNDGDMQRDERANVAVVSDRYWRTAFGRSESVLGQTIAIKGIALTIVGIAPPEFVGARTDAVADLWVPFTLQPTLGYSSNSSAYGGDRRKPWIDEDLISWLNIVARVDPAKQAQATAILRTANAAGLQAMADRLGDPRERTSTVARSLVVTPFAQGFSGLRNRFSDALYAMAAMVAIVLLVTCANISNLLLARATGRRRDTGIRLALGATTGRLLRQYLVESLLLSMAGGLISLLAAQWTSTFLAYAVLGRSGDLPPVFAPDTRVWIVTAALSLASSVAFGLVPALRAIRTGRSFGIGLHQRISAHLASKGMRPLVAVQLALSFAVVFGAVLLGRTLAYFANVDPGFSQEHVLTAAIDPDSSGYSRDQISALVDRLLASTASVPGVQSASVSTCGLMANCSYSSGFTIEGTGRRGIQLNNNWVAPAYFSTIGIPFVSGRDFNDADTPQSPRVAIVSESIARRFFPNQNPLGKRLGYEATDTEIVGVVRDIRPSLHADPLPMIYFPTRQPPDFVASPHAIVIRVTGDAEPAVPAIRAAIQRSEPGLLLDSVATMAAAFERDVARERIVAYLAFAFAFLALLLACVGLYGVLSYTVARRTQEIGVRMALGARPGDMIRMVVGDGSRVVLAGVAMGVAAAVVVGRLVTTLIAGVSASDPLTLAAVGVALVAVALCASYVPARRAARIAPATALRAE